MQPQQQHEMPGVHMPATLTQQQPTLSNPRGGAGGEGGGGGGAGGGGGGGQGHGTSGNTHTVAHPQAHAPQGVSTELK